MRRTSRSRRPVLAAVVTAAVAAAIALPSIASADFETPPLNTLEDGGHLLLSFTNNGVQSFRWVKADGTTLGGRETIRASGSCAGSVGGLAGDDDLVSVSTTGTNSTLGLEKGPGGSVIGLGVKSQGSASGTTCGQLNKGETLTIALSGLLDGYLVDGAELDVDAKFNTTIKATMKSGSNVVATQSTPTTGSDSGPDATSKDNVAVPVSSPLFDSMTLEALAPAGKGTLALEGGRSTDPVAPGGLREDLGTTDTVFHLVKADGVLDCGQTAPPESSDGGTTVTVFRGNNADGSDCVLVPYSLDVDDINAILLKDLTGQEAATFTVTINWEPVDAEYPNTHSVEIDLDGDGTDFDPATPPFCSADENGDPIAPAVGEFPWCVASTTVVTAPPANGVDQMRETDVLLGRGDPTYRYH